jgi:hypothetical protein
MKNEHQDENYFLKMKTKTYNITPEATSSESPFYFHQNFVFYMSKNVLKITALFLKSAVFVRLLKFFRKRAEWKPSSYQPGPQNPPSSWNVGAPNVEGKIIKLLKIFFLLSGAKFLLIFQLRALKKNIFHFFVPTKIKKNFF